MSDRLSRRTLLSGLGAALLADCSTDSVTTKRSAAASGALSPPRRPPAPSVTVTAATGPVTVPGAPQRVIALGPAELDSAMTLGITPVGACRLPDGGLPGYWPAERLAEIAPTGAVGAPDLAASSVLRPELILGNRAEDGGSYDGLQRIAPTVLTTTTGYPWKDNFQLHAQALSRQAQAAAVAEAYRQHIGQAIQAIVAAGSAGRRISLVRFTAGSAAIRLYGRRSFPGTLLGDLQLGRPDAQNVDQGEITVTVEQLAAADGDYLYYATVGDPGQGTSAAFRASSQWQNLAAVRAHRAFPVDDQLWFQGIGYTGANLVVAELQRLLGA